MILPQRGLKDLWNLKVALRNQINFKKPQSRAPVSMGAVGASTTLLITFPLINFHREKRKARIISFGQKMNPSTHAFIFLIGTL